MSMYEKNYWHMQIIIIIVIVLAQKQFNGKIFNAP